MIDVPSSYSPLHPVSPKANAQAEVNLTPILCNLANSCFLSRQLQGTTGKLSDEVLRNVFCYYVETFPQFWPRLAHVCRSWRRVVFTSQRALHLRLFCTHGTPVMKSLECWPSLPLVVEYGGSLALDPPVPEDDDNIMAALEHCGRVRSISLTVTRSLLEKFYKIKGPFSELEHLVLLCRDRVQLTLPSTFQWGPRLRSLHLAGIAPLGLLKFLSSSRCIVDLQLICPVLGVLHPNHFLTHCPG